MLEEGQRNTKREEEGKSSGIGKTRQLACRQNPDKPGGGSKSRAVKEEEKQSLTE